MSAPLSSTPSRRVLCEVRTGTRLVCGTEWPISAQLVRVVPRAGAAPVWLVVTGLCNGVPESTRAHRQLASADRAFAALLAQAVE